jgi:hypothetical protein
MSDDWPEEYGVVRLEPPVARVIEDETDPDFNDPALIHVSVNGLRWTYYPDRLKALLREQGRLSPKGDLDRAGLTREAIRITKEGDRAWQAERAADRAAVLRAGIPTDDLLPHVEVIDGRSVIRKSRAYEATIGPPRGHPKNELPPLGKAGAKLRSSAEVAVSDDNRHARDFHSEFSEIAERVPPLADPHDPADILFVSKIMDLWARGPRNLSQFLLHFACDQMRRTELEAALDRHLGSKSTCSGSMT